MYHFKVIFTHISYIRLAFISLLMILFSAGGNAGFDNYLHEKTSEFLSSQRYHGNEILIPSLALSAPYVETNSWTGEQAFKSLENGVVLLPTAGWLPGDKIVLTAHSSGTLVDNKQPFIFSGIGGLKDNADIFLWRNNKLAKYSVKGHRIVSPYDVSALKQENDHTLTLVTCWPIGDNKKRILVVADREQNIAFR